MSQKQLLSQFRSSRKVGREKKGPKVTTAARPGKWQNPIKSSLRQFSNTHPGVLGKKTRKKGVTKRSDMDHMHIMCRTEVSHKEGGRG